MAIQIPTIYLNRIATITRPADPSTADASGVIGAHTTVSLVAKIRIYQNDDYGGRTGKIEEQGVVAASSHKAVVGANEDVLAGDTLVDNATSESFSINLVDSQPAGYVGSHKEIWLTSSEYK
jgi:hypothetical protein